MSKSTGWKQNLTVSDPLRPQDQKLLHPGYNMSMFDMVKENQDSNTTKNQDYEKWPGKIKNVPKSF